MATVTLPSPLNAVSGTPDAVSRTARTSSSPPSEDPPTSTSPSEASMIPQPTSAVPDPMSAVQMPSASKAVSRLPLPSRRRTRTSSSLPL